MIPVGRAATQPLRRARLPAPYRRGLAFKMIMADRTPVQGGQDRLLDVGLDLKRRQ